jgi:hypothetical protein
MGLSIMRQFWETLENTSQNGTPPKSPSLRSPVTSIREDRTQKPWASMLAVVSPWELSWFQAEAFSALNSMPCRRRIFKNVCDCVSAPSLYCILRGHLLLLLRTSWRGFQLLTKCVHSWSDFRLVWVLAMILNSPQRWMGVDRSPIFHLLSRSNLQWHAPTERTTPLLESTEPHTSCRM